MTITVSIVEDDRRTRDGLVSLINGIPGLNNGTQEFRCLGAYPNGVVALKQIPLDPPKVILMDLRLPKLSGIECLKLLKAKVPSVKVVMLTQYEEAENIFAALKAGADGYVFKTSSPQEILQAIRDTLEDRPPISAEVAVHVLKFFRKLGRNSSELQKLTARETEILGQLANGLTCKEIAAKLEITLNTVNGHIKNIYAKLNAHNQADAVAKGLRHGLIS